MSATVTASVQYRSEPLEHDGYRTAYLDTGPHDGVPVVAVHGSGPGVSAAANWRPVYGSALAATRRVVAPDIAGFGATDVPEGRPLSHETRVEHLIGFLDALGAGPVDVIGNSMGGGLALAVADRRPDLVRSLVLMGSVGVTFPITDGLSKVWGYRPSFEAMRELMTLFAYDPNLVSDDLVRLRHETSAEPHNRSRYEAAFTEPLQQHVEAMALAPEALARITVPTLLIHGAEDLVVPLSTSLDLVRLLPASDLVVFGHCGHWTQIERTADFVRHVGDFLDVVDARATARTTH
ncbi:alpha/beta fold hydrolase [Jatrophihabitans fulvus]